MTPQPAQQWARLRIGDAERDEAAAALGEHFAVGRLDHAEYSQRLDAVWSARTRGDLDVLFHDLPSPVRAVAPPLPTRPGVPSALLVALVVLAVVAVLAQQSGLLVVAGLVAFVVLRRRRRHQRWLMATRQHPGPSLGGATARW